MLHPLLYKHENNTDVAILIKKSFYIPEKRLWKLKIEWWNIGGRHHPFAMGIEEKIEMTQEQRGKWKPYVWGVTEAA